MERELALRENEHQRQKARELEEARLHQQEAAERKQKQILQEERKRLRQEALHGIRERERRMQERRKQTEAITSRLSADIHNNARRADLKSFACEESSDADGFNHNDSDASDVTSDIPSLKSIETTRKQPSSKTGNRPAWALAQKKVVPQAQKKQVVRQMPPRKDRSTHDATQVSIEKPGLGKMTRAQYQPAAGDDGVVALNAANSDQTLSATRASELATDIGGVSATPNKDLDQPQPPANAAMHAVDKVSVVEASVQTQENTTEILQTASTIITGALADTAAHSLPGIRTAPLVAVDECVLRLVALQRNLNGGEVEPCRRQLSDAANGLAPWMLHVLESARELCEASRTKLQTFCGETGLDLKAVDGGLGYLQPQFGALDRLGERYAAFLPSTGAWPSTASHLSSMSAAGLSRAVSNMPVAASNPCGVNGCFQPHSVPLGVMNQSSPLNPSVDQDIQPSHVREVMHSGHTSNGPSYERPSISNNNSSSHDTAESIDDSQVTLNGEMGDSGNISTREHVMPSLRFSAHDQARVPLHAALQQLRGVDISSARFALGCNKPANGKTAGLCRPLTQKLADNGHRHNGSIKDGRRKAPPSEDKYLDILQSLHAMCATGGSHGLTCGK